MMMFNTFIASTNFTGGDTIFDSIIFYDWN